MKPDPEHNPNLDPDYTACNVGDTLYGPASNGMAANLTTMECVSIDDDYYEFWIKDLDRVITIQRDDPLHFYYSHWSKNKLRVLKDMLTQGEERLQAEMIRHRGVKGLLEFRIDKLQTEILQEETPTP